MAYGRGWFYLQWDWLTQNKLDNQSRCCITTWRYKKLFFIHATFSVTLLTHKYIRYNTWSILHKCPSFRSATNVNSMVDFSVIILWISTMKKQLMQHGSSLICLGGDYLLKLLGYYLMPNKSHFVASQHVVRILLLFLFCTYHSFSFMLYT